MTTVLNPYGYDAPSLNALDANERNYKVLLMQPYGQIEATTAGVFNRNRVLARLQFGKFLKDAYDSQADLVVTPEYSMPWEILVQSIKTNIVPSQGRLWVLGCESIKYNDLESVKRDLAPYATMIYEPISADRERFTDPLAYVFYAPPVDGHGAAKLVLLVQFKNYPMGDKDHFEINGMQRGTRIYQFGGNGQPIKLVSLICSDVFRFEDADAEAIYDRALVIHIQLNPKPRHEQFRLYRDRLLKFQGDETELICLNWARDVHAWCGEQDKPWNNIAGSAWYLRPDKYDERDATLCANHQRGLYYTWHQPLRAHALFFNYEPATFLLDATKVAHIGVPAAISRRRGPQIAKTCNWSDAAGAWIEKAVVEDGFSIVVNECGPAKDEIKGIADDNPLNAERVLALCAGKVGHSDDWHNVRKLDSCVIDLSEVIRRITFCHDTDERACEFRIARLRRCGNLWGILKTEELPSSLADFKNGFHLDWSLSYPHQNAISLEGKRATVIYMGEEASAVQVEAVAKRALEFIGRGCSDPDKIHDARQRLAVWFRDNGKIVRYDTSRFVQYDQSGNTSEFDIGRDV